MLQHGLPQAGGLIGGMMPEQQRHFLPPQMAASTASVPPTTNGSQPLKALLPVVPPHCGPPTVSLALLLDFAIHHTLHDLIIISELNLKKKPEDRKISVVQFAHSTRLIFVRLLAIVRWLKTHKKFEPLTSIRFLLDEQAARYIETADKLVEIARNELPNARLPVFQVAQAVDVLTLGSYPRLPQNIKDRFISKPLLTGRELRLTLRQLNRVLEYHLAKSARQLSPRIEQISIRNGIATLLVPNEFEMALTRLGDDPQTKWSLMNIRILVENAEVGQGQRLVHPLQVNFLHQMVQTRLENSERPLHDTYCVLHSFCRSLQLDVLYCQALQIAKMSSNYIRVDEYNVKECRLALSYWLVRDGGKTRLSSKHRLLIYGDKAQPNSSLKTKHWPASPELPKMDQSLSLQRLLNETVSFRCRERLLKTQQLLGQTQSPTMPIGQSGHCLLKLCVPLILLDESHADESLIVAVNTFFGTLHCRVEILGPCTELRDLEQQLNSTAPSLPTISRLIDRLRILVIMERLQKAIVGLQVRPFSDAQALPLVKKLSSLPADRRVFQFIREEQHFLVISFLPDEQLGVKIQFHLFSALEGNLMLLDLDAEQIVRNAPKSRNYAVASQQREHGAEFREFFHRYRRQPTTK